MSKYTADEIKEILERHKRWLEESDGWSEDDRADLSRADLSRADLSGAYLSGADLSGADLSRADLSGANLSRANLSGADLSGADLSRADLSGADLSRANLYRANLSDETKIRLCITCPDTGSFIAWKKAGDYIVKLEIPEDAKRSSATTRKCRASKAKVLEIQNVDGSKAEVDEVISDHGGIYKVGEMIYPDKWDDCRWNECSHGIHFFVTRMEAEDW